MHRLRNGKVIGLIIAALVFTGWRILAMPSAAVQPLTVAAAANLQFAFKEIGQLFELETGQPVVFTFGSSGNLAHQIRNGAPVDVFAAANVAYVDDLRARGLVAAGTQQIYAQGRVVLAVNRSSGVQVEELEDLLRPEVTHVAIANPGHAPYGMAAKQALQSTGLWDALQSKLVYGETVQQAMRFVQTGNAQVGLIALAVADVPELRYTLIDADLHQPLNQAIAVISDSPHLAAAQNFVAFVNGPQGRQIMQRYGFQLPTVVGQ